MLTIHATCGAKKACCDCPDAQCYQDCCAAFLGVLSTAARLGAAAHYGNAQADAAGGHDYKVEFCVKDDRGTEVTRLGGFVKAPDAAFVSALDAAFASCCAEQNVKKSLRP